MALAGKELLIRAKELGARGVGKTGQAKACGYVRTVQRGESAGAEVIDTHAFLSALAEANGLTFGNGTRGYTPSGMLRVNTNGQVIVGPSYLKKLGIAPGSTVKVETIEENGELVLVATD
jgi:uncharacterized membrane protein